jgi:Transcriptional regulators of sugar metabolism
MSASDKKNSRTKTALPSNDRNEAILDMLRVRRSMKISELQEILGVSDMTVRRCLNDLASEGHLKRVHGGAVIIDSWEKELAFHTRIAENLDVKLALAASVQTFIPNGGSVYLDGGTTCYEIAKKLSTGMKKCTIITDSIAIVREFLGKENIEAILLGGRLANDGNTLDGPVAQEAASRMSVDLCIVSCDSFNNQYLQTQSLTGAQTKRLMIERSALSMCATASNKYGKNRCFQFSDWQDVDMFVTDADLPEEAKDAIESNGVEVHLVDVP